MSTLPLVLLLILAVTAQLMDDWFNSVVVKGRSKTFVSYGMWRLRRETRVDGKVETELRRLLKELDLPYAALVETQDIPQCSPQVEHLCQNWLMWTVRALAWTTCVLLALQMVSSARLQTGLAIGSSVSSLLTLVLFWVYYALVHCPKDAQCTVQFPVPMSGSGLAQYVQLSVVVATAYVAYTRVR